MITCCRKEVLLLVLWKFLLVLSVNLAIINRAAWLGNSGIVKIFLNTSIMAAFTAAPFFGWLADVKVGRYRLITFGAIIAFFASVVLSIGLLIFNEVFSCIAAGLLCIGSVCFSAALLPFVTDQMIGASSRELSAVVYWYYWAACLGVGLASVTACSVSPPVFGVIIAVPCAALLGAIVISDCLCLQWLDRSHKVTNPIKLIIQVLNYTRKHRYPERRSAFTYIDEEQPTRMDFGKKKFGGPFTEEEVEDVKTILRLLPLMGCISFSVKGVDTNLSLDAFSSQYLNCVINYGAEFWLAPLLFIPVFQCLLHSLLHNWVPSILKRIGMGLFLHLIGYALCTAVMFKGYLQYTDDGIADISSRYLTCTPLNTTQTLDRSIEWFWKFPPLVLFSVSRAVVNVLLLEFAIAQSPDKMKGLVIGLEVSSVGIGRAFSFLLYHFIGYTICYDLPMLLLPTVLFVFFLFLSKRYTFRERNREINIQAIVEEHHERYLDQEEQYYRMKGQCDLSECSNIITLAD